MKILIIQPWIQLGGAELLSVHLAYQLRKQGHDVSIACTFLDLNRMPPQAHEVHYVLPNVSLARLCARSRHFFLVFGPWILLDLVWKHSRNVDVLNPHNFPASWVAALAGAWRRIPVVWTCNEPPSPVPWRDALKVGLGDFLGWLVASSWLDKFFVQGLQALHVPSEKTRQQVRERYGRDPMVIPLGVDVRSFEAGNGVDPAYNCDLRGKFVLLTVGKLHPQKNQVLCLEALRRVLPQIPDTILVLAGDGPMRASWQWLAERWGIAQQVRFLGHVSGLEIQDLYQACDVNLFPPLNQSWGLTPFEALCAGRMSIVSSDCGAAEVLAREGIGVVCEPTPEAFAEEILKVYQDPSGYRRMAAKGRDYVRRNLTWGRYGEKVERLIQSSHVHSQSLPRGADGEEARNR